MRAPMHYEDARWRDVPRLLCLLVHEAQNLRVLMTPKASPGDPYEPMPPKVERRQPIYGDVSVSATRRLCDPENRA